MAKRTTAETNVAARPADAITAPPALDLKPAEPTVSLSNIDGPRRDVADEPSLGLTAPEFANEALPRSEFHNDEASQVDTSSLKTLSAVADLIDAPQVDAPEARATAAREAPALEGTAREPIMLGGETFLAPERNGTRIDPPTPELIMPLMADDPPLPPQSHGDAVAAPIATTSTRSNRFMLLAASVALAACIGATAGAIGVAGLAPPLPAQAIAAPSPAIGAEDMRALQGAVTELRNELAALKISVELGAKSANGQFAKITERLDRAHSEQAARISKPADGAERPEKRADLTPVRDVTGSVAPTATAAASQPNVAGWVLREVNRGVALIEGRLGLIEVEAGDVVPGLGRIEAIRKQANRWVVVTARGLVTSVR